MTRLYEGMGDEDPYPGRHGFRNFTWTPAAVAEWEPVWDSLWRLGIKWEWQNSDRYARRRGEIHNLFSCHNDAMRLDMAIPLPGVEVILGIHEYLLDLPTEDHQVDEATNLIRKWIKNYV